MSSSFDPSQNSNSNSGFRSFFNRSTSPNPHSHHSNNPNSPPSPRNRKRPPSDINNSNQTQSSSHQPSSSSSSIPVPATPTPGSILTDLAPHLMQRRILGSDAFQRSPKDSGTTNKRSIGAGNRRHNPGFVERFSPLGQRVGQVWNVNSNYNSSSSSGSGTVKGPSGRAAIAGIGGQGFLTLPSSRTSSLLLPSPSPSGPKSALSLSLLESVDSLLSLPIPSPSTTTNHDRDSHLQDQQRGLIEPSKNNAEEGEEEIPLHKAFLHLLPSSSSHSHRLDRRKKRERVLLLSLPAPPTTTSTTTTTTGSGRQSMGLKTMGERGRGLLGAPGEVEEEDEMGKGKGKAMAIRGRKSRGRFSMGVQQSQSSGGGGEGNSGTGETGDLSGTAGAGEEEKDWLLIEEDVKHELVREVDEIGGDLEGVGIRRTLINQEIATVSAKIASLEMVKEELRQSLLSLREEELELEDELENVRDSLTYHTKLAEREQRHRIHQQHAGVSSNPPSRVASGTTGFGAEEGITGKTLKRPKGPTFLPSEHDELPPGVAFMTLSGHSGPITSLDFSEPYGTMVTSSTDETVRVWDLTTGEEWGRLRGHKGMVKSLQVESNICVSGGSDGGIRIWDLDLVEEEGFLNDSDTEDSDASIIDHENESDIGGGGMLGGRGMGRNIPRAEGRPNAHLSATEGRAMESVLLGRAGDPKANGMLGAENDDGMRKEESKNEGKGDPACVKVMEGHTMPVTSLYFDGNCLVTGSSDKTLRQWDLTTGQCVLTMDILWAISSQSSSAVSHSSDFTSSFATVSNRQTRSYGGIGAGSSDSPFDPPSSGMGSGGGSKRLSSNSFLLPGSGKFAAPMPPFADGSWEMYEDFVGGVQFWGYALASGSGDGCLRMWDMRTGQAHRTLVGHTAPVTCLQFDEVHLVSGSLDKSIRIWDLRTGAITDTLKYEHPITALQFDTRKIIAAAGENGVRSFNRTTLQHSSININGHTGPTERVRFVDRYLASGSRDYTIKLWSLG